MLREYFDGASDVNNGSTDARVMTMTLERRPILLVLYCWANTVTLKKLRVNDVATETAILDS
jgi:hypothetical protein